MYADDYIIISFVNGLGANEIDSFAFTSYDGRSESLPEEMVLEYYTGTTGSSATYDSTAWVTYSTLTNVNSVGTPLWSNITEGSTIAHTAL
jgi:hypothetical protein